MKRNCNQKWALAKSPGQSNLFDIFSRKIFLTFWFCFLEVTFKICSHHIHPYNCNHVVDPHR